MLISFNIQSELCFGITIIETNPMYKGTLKIKHKSMYQIGNEIFILCLRMDIYPKLMERFRK